MAAAFNFSGYATALAPWRDALNEGYQARPMQRPPQHSLPPCCHRVSSRMLLRLLLQVCLKKMNEQAGTNGRTKAADWKVRMGKRILEADNEHARKRARHA